MHAAELQTGQLPLPAPAMEALGLHSAPGRSLITGPRNKSPGHSAGVGEIPNPTGGLSVGWGHPAAPLAHPAALSMPASSRFPSYLNTALFLAAGNPSWADNSALESDLKRKSPLLLFFFLTQQIREASTFPCSPGGA